MAKRTVEVKLPSACPRRHSNSNPVLFVPLKSYVLVASGSTPLANKTAGLDMHHLLFLFNTYASRPCILLASSSQVEHKGFLLWYPALHCGMSVGFVVRATLF